MTGTQDSPDADRRAFLRRCGLLLAVLVVVLAVAIWLRPTRSRTAREAATRGEQQAAPDQTSRTTLRTDTTEATGEITPGEGGTRDGSGREQKEAVSQETDKTVATADNHPAKPRSNRGPARRNPNGTIPEGTWPACFGNRPAHPTRSPDAIQPLPPDLNPHVRSVVEASRTGTHPERLSPMILPKPFDREAFQTKPEDYLNTIEPGRVWQEDPKGPPIQHIGATLPTIHAHEQTDLSVQAVPGGPVTFTSLDCGSFPNGLPSITVRADDKGVVRGSGMVDRGAAGEGREADARG